MNQLTSTSIMPGAVCMHNRPYSTENQIPIPISN